MSFNPLKTFKNALNQTGEQIGVAYDDVTKNVLKTATEVVAVTDPNILPESTLITKIKALSETGPGTGPEVENKTITVENELYMNKIPMLSKYKGCYSDDPNTPILSEYLGIVSNVAQCIKLGAEHKLNYVGIQQGDVCYGGNQIPNYAVAETSNVNCDISCSEAGVGNCGGYFYSQIYDTGIKPNDLVQMVMSENKNIETFESVNNHKPLKPFVSFGWIVLILVIILVTICYFKNVDL